MKARLPGTDVTPVQLRKRNGSVESLARPGSGPRTDPRRARGPPAFQSTTSHRQFRTPTIKPVDNRTGAAVGPPESSLATSTDSFGAATTTLWTAEVVATQAR
jgi:hypothetical protein